MTGESANSQKMLLATAVAEGTAVAKWASSNEVPELAPRVLDIRRRGIVDDTIAMVREAVACGFKDVGRLRTEQGFAPIRSTRKFQAVMCDLDFPRHPFARARSR